MKININQIITILILVMSAIGFFSIGNRIQKNGKPTIDFCYEHYHNKTFLDTTTYFTEDDPSTPLVCINNIHNPYPYSNPDMKKCLEENATEEQIRFMENCHWMGLDFLILAGTMFFKLALPLMLFGMIVAIIYSMFKEEDKNVLQTCSGKSETE